jgi:hypothetical protein
MNQPSLAKRISDTLLKVIAIYQEVIKSYNNLTIRITENIDSIELMEIIEQETKDIHTKLGEVDKLISDIKQQVDLEQLDMNINTIIH